jgi:heme/copper-type cytochrome/quinol oxidase subunit 2
MTACGSDSAFLPPAKASRALAATARTINLLPFILFLFVLVVVIVVFVFVFVRRALAVSWLARGDGQDRG